MTVPLSDTQLAAITAEYERTTHPGWQDSAPLGLVLAEVHRLRAEQALSAAIPAQPLDRFIVQQCPAGVHADWAADTEDAHVCPWCEVEQLRAELASATDSVARIQRWAATTDHGSAAAEVLLLNMTWPTPRRRTDR